MVLADNRTYDFVSHRGWQVHHIRMHDTGRLACGKSTGTGKRIREASIIPEPSRGDLCKRCHRQIYPLPKRRMRRTRVERESGVVMPHPKMFVPEDQR